MLDLFQKIKPKNPILRAYLLGVMTGMGAAVAYVWGLSWRAEAQAKQQQFAREFFGHVGGQPYENESQD